MSKTKSSVFDRLTFEIPLWEKGLRVGGMDEVGRGPLAGPVTAACVVLQSDAIIEGVNDSKKLTASQRQYLSICIKQKALAYHIVHLSAQVIDEVNILQATQRAMVLAVQGLSLKPEQLLVDAVKNLELDIPVLSIIKGDALSYLIGAASIIAKVERDKLMEDYDRQYPQYGFAKHKGYGTAEHIAALKKFGPCPIHRKSFIKHFWEE